ncbi:hypothetical protein CJ030_MR0G007456 [Morella rubra]|uniref:Uncharacterized protein n=1 Tax=Morella rubra TaxID=262757 RepID=A0A6A1UMK8_9ROSI|nr:hypothetical protein CJ030_MR0G007456 [Morella rubra]
MLPPSCENGLPNYKIMCKLFLVSTATEKFYHASTTSPPDTDYERDIKDDLIGSGIDDSHDPSNTSAPSSAQPPLTLPTNSAKSDIDSTSSVHHCNKRSKGNSVADTNSMALLKFVGAQNRHNDILEQRVAMKSKSHGMTGPSEDEYDVANDLYSKCLLLMQSVMQEDDNNVFLKEWKELENIFAQKVFLVMTDSQRKAWLYSLWIELRVCS